MNENPAARLIWHGIDYDALLFEAQVAEPSGEMADRLHSARFALSTHPRPSAALYKVDALLHQEWMRHRY